MPKALMAVWTRPANAENADDYNRWYDEKHLHDVIGIEGIVSATRYKVDAGVELLPTIPHHSLPFLAVYELEARTTEDLQAIADRMKAGIADGSVDLSPTVDITALECSFLLPLGNTVP